MKKQTFCVSEAELNDYLNRSLDKGKRQMIEEHLNDCDACLGKILFAHETLEEFRNQKIKERSVMIRKNIWLAGAVIAFVFSFLIPRYFLQFLTATIILGAKWIFESSNARILIMIYDAWKRGGEKEASRIIKSLSDRMKF